jgi:hypothetical protein
VNFLSGGFVKKNSWFILLLMSVALPLVSKADGFKANYDAGSCKSFSSGGKGKYFDLTPGFQQVFDGEEKGEKAHLVITVTDRTKKVAGVETRVVQEYEMEGGKLAEISWNYMAICKDSGDLCYFGEDVDEYQDGKLQGHGSSWLAGKKRAVYGVMVPANPAVGQKYYQEQAPKEALDRAEVVSVSENFDTPAGKFKNCVKTDETTPLEPGDPEAKLYAPGIGLVQDGGLRLVKYGMNVEEVGTGKN